MKLNFITVNNQISYSFSYRGPWGFWAKRFLHMYLKRYVFCVHIVEGGICTIIVFWNSSSYCEGVIASCGGQQPTLDVVGSLGCQVSFLCCAPPHSLPCLLPWSISASAKTSQRNVQYVIFDYALGFDYTTYGI
jgi:hypothetical protein